MKDSRIGKGKGAGKGAVGKSGEGAAPSRRANSLPLDQLRQKLALVEAIISATDVMLLYLDRDFNYLLVNESYAASCGMQPDELLGKNHFTLHPHPEDEAIFRQVRDTGEPVFCKDKPCEFSDQPERGSTYWDWSLTPVKDDDGLVRGLVFSLRETTKYKRAELTLVESEERFRRMAETCTDIIFQMDTRGRITYASPALHAFGYRAEQVLGEPFMKFVPLAELPKAQAALARINAGESISLFELTLIKGDGVLVDCEISATPIIQAGAVAGMQGLVRDIGARKRSEVELFRLNQVLKALGDSRRAALLASSEASYLDEVCRIVVEDCGFSMVWVGYAEENAERTVRPMAQSGLGSDYLESVRITWDDSEFGQGPTGTAIRTGRVAGCRNMLTDPNFVPWRAQAIKRGYASSLVFPLLHEGSPFGALTIYSPEPDGFSQGETALLNELSEDLAYGIVALRERRGREEAEAALRRNEAQLQIILNSISEGLVVADLGGELIYWNPAAVTMHGYADASEGLRRLRELADTFVLTDNAGVVVPLAEWPLARILRGETLSAWELRVCRRDRDWQRVFSYSGGLALDNRGRPVLGVVVVSDITERKRSDERVLRAKQEWERTFDAVPDLIVILDKDHRVVRANRAMAARLGQSPGDLVGVQCFSCVHGTCGPPGVCPHALTMRDGQEHAAELHEDRLGGDFLVTTTPLFDAAGMMTGSVHVSRDITERKKAEARIRALNEELQESVTQLEEVNQELDRSNQDLQQFAYIASHDLQGPLHTVASFLQLLERRYQGKLDEKADAYINFAVEGTAYMQRLLVDLLAFSRVGGGELKLRPVDLGTVVGRVVFNLQKAIVDHGAEVVIDSELPVVVADESQMLHLLQNLIANAIKFHGEAPPRVEIFAELREGQWTICVRDHGIGIDPSFAERIFLIFQRLHKREEYGGTGIGLAICKKIVERHGGRIWVESSPGQGATFCFSLPVRREANVA